MTDTHTHTDRQTDASDLIICPLLCYSNGTDNKKYLLLVTFETDDNYSIRFEMQKHYSHSTS